VKRFIALVAAAALAVSLAAVAGARTSAPPTMKPGELVVGFGDPAVNFANGKIRGSNYLNPKGYEVDLAKAIAKKLHLTPEWMYSPWTGLFAPGTKKFDVSFQEATITAQRKKTVDFSATYMNANQGVLLSKQAPVPGSIAALRKLQTCAQQDTTGLQYIQDQLKPDKKPLVFPTTTALYQSVQLNRCQAVILDVPLVSLEAKSKPGAFGPLAGQIVTHEQYGAVLQKGSKLTSVIDRTIKQLTKNGTIGKLQKKWFNIDFSKVHVLK
jgi:polar amino acid transport system substrate-binding protein